MPRLSRGRLNWTVGTTVLMLCAMAGLAGVTLATTYTVQMAKSSVVNQKTHKTSSENIVVTTNGFALYELSGDSKTHQECTKSGGCWQFWPPATVKAGTHVTKGPGVPGTLSTWKRSGIVQLTLNGHPLYQYAADAKAHTAAGEDVTSFGGTWHVITAAKSSGGGGGW